LPEKHFATTLADAMTPDELPSPPRKASWRRLLLVLACVVAVTTIALLAITPKKEPVKVWFVRSTNASGVKTLVFQGTNGVPTQILFYADVFTNAPLQAKAAHALGPVNGWTRTNVPAGTNFILTLEAPPNNVPYYVVWAFSETGPPATLWGRFRRAGHDFFKAHGMPGLSRRFGHSGEAHSIPSTEITE
jgi:hypothetical protein